MAAGKSVMVLFLMSVLWMSSSYGHTNADLEYDADDEWPVLCPPETFYNIKKVCFFSYICHCFTISD